MDAPALHRSLCLAMLGLGALTFAALLVIPAPYGRHARAGWGPTLPSRLGWVLMESPAVVWFAAVYLAGRHRAEAAPLALLGLWQAHYLHRVLVFPFRMRAPGRRMPVAVAAMAFGFNLLNGWLNARWISDLGAYPSGWLQDPRFVIGAALFVLGFAVNVRADSILFRLRSPGESGYRIPRGFLYEWVTCPNYLGEILEWIGWAVATWSLPGLAFAAYTFANLAPRALAHHRWYRSRFPDYPADRKALVPFVL